MYKKTAAPKEGTPDILIVHQEQFGYHSDTYYYCKYLSPAVRVAYICWDYHREKMRLPGIRVIYVSRRGNLLQRNLRFIAYVLSEIKTTSYAFHFIKYFRGASLVRLLSGKRNIMVDIRSGATNPKPVPRVLYDLLMRTETAFFSHVSVISPGLRKRLNLPARTYVLPLGAESFSRTDKTFASLDLLYVGTLYSRNIHETILGFSKFYRKFRDRFPMRYTIIGSGYGNEEAELNALVASLGLKGVVTLTGYIVRDGLPPYFDSHNLGVSYVPMTSYYDAQPPTKNFEYLLSGMPVIATATRENQASVNHKNGILIQDSPDGFFRGLITFMENRDRYDSGQIRTEAAPYTWEKIVSRFSQKLKKLMEPQ